MDSLSLIVEYISNQQWAIQIGLLEQMVKIVDRHISGVKLSADEVAEAIGKSDTEGDVVDRDDNYYVLDGSVGVVPVSGVIAKYSRMVNGVSQPRGSSIEMLNKQLDRAMDDDSVKSILLHIESPGGSIAGLMDFADNVFEASKQKPVIAFADDLACSAAYWIGSQASEFYANKSAVVGSIGVYSLLLDSSGAYEKAGLKMHIVRSGENKGVGAQGIEITDEQVSTIQTVIDAHYEGFIGAILRGRADKGLVEDKLRKVADGRVLTAAQAKRAKLIDGIKTFDSVINKISAGRGSIRDSVSAEHRVAAESENEILENLEDKEIVMVDKVEKAEKDALVEQTRKDERARITAIGDALEGEAFDEIRMKAITEGMSITEAKAAGFDIAKGLLANADSETAAKLASAEEKLAAIATGGSKVQAADVNDDVEANVASGDSSDASAFETLKGQLMSSGKTEAEAITAAARRCPVSHRAWVGQQDTRAD
jgi:signal peptide peptidase SppA